MKLEEFFKQFDSEEKCKLHLKACREKEGIICKKCEGTKHYWLKAKWQWQCAKCSFRTTLRSGTWMQHTQLSFKKWFICMEMMTGTNKGVSAKELQRQLEHSRYRTIWELMHRVRELMGKAHRDSYHTARLSGRSEMEEVKGKKINRMPLHVKVEFSTKTYQKSRSEIFYRLKSELWVSNSLKGKRCYKWAFEIQNPQPDKMSAFWKKVHFQNLFEKLIGVHHCVSLVYLQNYFDEYCYLQNRKWQKNLKFSYLLKCLVGTTNWYAIDHS
jgi:hypothetical protein